MIFFASFLEDYMNESFSDLIYLVIFAFIMFILNSRKRKTKRRVEEASALEKKREVFSSEKEQLRKPAFLGKKVSEEAGIEDKTLRTKAFRPIPTPGILDAHKEEPDSSSSDNAVKNSSAKDMVILSAIYFNPYN